MKVLHYVDRTVETVDKFFKIIFLAVLIFGILFTSKSIESLNIDLDLSSISDQLSRIDDRLQDIENTISTTNR